MVTMKILAKIIFLFIFIFNLNSCQLINQQERTKPFIVNYPGDKENIMKPYSNIGAVYNVQSDKENNLILTRSQDLDSQNYIFQIDPMTCRILGRSKTIRRIEKYFDNNEKYWFFAGKGSILWFSKTNLQHSYFTSTSGTQAFKLSTDRFFESNGSQYSPEKLQCVGFDGKLLWQIDLIKEAKNKNLIQSFYKVILEKNKQILLFSYGHKNIDNTNLDISSIDNYLSYWLFERDTGKLIDSNKLGSIYYNSAVIDSWGDIECFYNDGNNILLTRSQKDGLVFENYFWDGNQPPSKTWSTFLPGKPKSVSDSRAGGIPLHNKIFSDSLHYWCIFQKETENQKGDQIDYQYESNLLGFNKQTGKIDTQKKISNNLVKDWEMQAGQFFFLYENQYRDNGGVCSINIKELTIRWDYSWNNPLDKQCIFHNGLTLIILSKNKEKDLQIIGCDGKISYFGTFVDTHIVSTKTNTGINSFLEEFNIFLIPRNQKEILAISNRGYMYDLKMP